MEKANKKLESDILELKSELQKQRAFVTRMQSSISWRITRPLRSLSHRFPIAGERVVRTLKFFYQFPQKLKLKTQHKSKQISPQAKIKYELPFDILEQISHYKTSENIKPKKIVIYTAIFGDYDSLLIPEVIDPEIDYVCFTDRPRNTYGVWKFKTTPYYNADPTRTARYVKTHPHELLPGYEFAVWIDGNVSLRTDIYTYIEKLKLANSPLGMIPHPLRDCFYEEAKECILRQKDSNTLINKQVEQYKKVGIKEKSGMYETNFMVIRLSDLNTKSLFNVWWEQIEKFSRRDQLALSYARESVKIETVDLLPKGVSVREADDFLYLTHRDCKELLIPDSLKEIGVIQTPFNADTFAEVKQQRLDKLNGYPIDIIVCVYNALEDVRLCLDSVNKYLAPAHRLIIVNDCSDESTSTFLRNFASEKENVVLLENQENIGYTQSANKGLAHGSSEFRVLLNSDTIVNENWCLKLLDVALQDESIGIVGPLSNAAGVQSVPDIKSSSKNTAINKIPENVTLEQIDDFLEHESPASAFPRLSLVHGFCFGVKKSVIDRIGYFDNENFARYYGEENDYCFRAKKAGFNFAIATNTFVYHRKSRSIDEEERIVHMGNAGKRLRELYGADKVKEACLIGENHPTLKHIRYRINDIFTK